jgi:TrmH RNA methyltransferase
VVSRAVRPPARYTFAMKSRRPDQPSAAPRLRRPAPRRGVKAGGGERRHRARTEELFHGLRACQAVFARLPEAIVRVYLTAARRKDCADLLAWCAREHRGFQIVAEDNLERLTRSLHHEGIAILARTPPRGGLGDLLAGIEAGTITGPLLCLDGVGNPHNLGSILRTAAHFGAGAVLGRKGDLPPLSAAVARVAEGAAECVPLFECSDPPADLERLRQAGYRVVVTAGDGGDSVFTAALPPRVVVVLGNEGAGVSRTLRGLADVVVRIPGTGAVESLNVAVACGVVLGEVWRRQAPAGTP